MQSIKPNHRIPELDGLRGLAILLVLFYHYFASSNLLPDYLSALGRLSWSGVDLFFVLSGFLLGGILLEAKTSPNYFKTFYVRRAYRILPAYFLTLIVFWVIGVSIKVTDANVAFHWLFSGAFPWYFYLTLTQNFAMTLRGDLGPAWMGATWSLAIEEQFYLTLPLIIRYVSRRRLPYVLGAIIVAAPLMRALLRLYYPNWVVATYVLMPCRSDALMLGVAAALLLRSDSAFKLLLTHRRLLYFAETVLLGGMIWMARKKTSDLPHEQITKVIGSAPQVVGHSLSNSWFLSRMYEMTISSLNYTWIALFYLGLLFIVVTQAGWLSRVMRSPWLIAPGTVAYGAYLFHQGVVGVWYGLVRGRLPVIQNLPDLGLTLIALATTLALAKISWTYFEKPLVERGHKYRYKHFAKESNEIPSSTRIN